MTDFQFWDDAPKPGNQVATILSFEVKDMTSTKGTPYKKLSMRVDLEGSFRFVNLSNKRTEEGSSTHNMLLQLAPQLNKTIDELIAIPASELFSGAIGKTITVFVNDRGYFDVAGPLELANGAPTASTGVNDPANVIDPESIPF